MHKFEDQVAYTSYYCLIHHDTNIFSVTLGEQLLLLRKIMRLLCNYDYCTKNNGKLENLTKISMSFE